MFFCNALRVLAWLGLILGLFQAVMGFGVAFEWISPEALRRYTTATTTGIVIDRGLFTIGVAVAAGALAEIGLSLRGGR